MMDGSDSGSVMQARQSRVMFTVHPSTMRKRGDAAPIDSVQFHRTPMGHQRPGQLPIVAGSLQLELTR